MDDREIEKRALEDGAIMYVFLIAFLACCVALVLFLLEVV